MSVERAPWGPMVTRRRPTTQETPAMDDPTRGLYGKYKVERLDGKPVDQAIVFELKDPTTWEPLLMWANNVEAKGYGRLAADVRALVGDASDG